MVMRPRWRRADGGVVGRGQSHGAIAAGTRKWAVVAASEVRASDGGQAGLELAIHKVVSPGPACG
jgi:hypothetical protein